MTRWTEEQVIAVAPDNNSAAAGRKLAIPGPWSDMGANESLVWGKCQGSGKNPYQVSVDIDAPAYRCSCPSRKFPCYHAIALLLMWARNIVGDEEALASFAEDWANQRAEKAENKTKKASAARPADPEAQAKRLAARLEKMDAGIEDFTLWLTDLTRGGLAAARSQPFSYWDRAAGRLVDAQLPGLAERVRTAAGESLRRDDWGDYLLRQVGRWQLLAMAWRHRDRLDDNDATDLRTTLGLSTPSEQVREGRTRTGTWQVLGAHRSEEGPLQQQRTWLTAEDGELALVLETAGPGQSLGVPQLAGARLQATLAFYPGNGPQRALYLDSPVPCEPATNLGTGTSVAESRRAAAESLSKAPWRSRYPARLAGIRITHNPALALDPDNTGIAVSHDSPIPMLLALTGGRPCDVFGELEDEQLRVLTVSIDGRVIAL